MKHNAPHPAQKTAATTASPANAPRQDSACADADLRALLQAAAQAEPTPAASPDFRSTVWARIETLRAAPATWGQWLRSHALGVGVACAVCVLVAALSGGLLARQQALNERREQFQRYLVSIDAHHRLAFEADARHSSQQ